MIIEKYYSNITNTYYDEPWEAEKAEWDWAKAIVREYGDKGYIATDDLLSKVSMLNTKTDARTFLSLEMTIFVPLYDDLCKAFLIFAEADGDEIGFNLDDFKARTPIKYDFSDGQWVLMPDLVKRAHLIYTELSDIVASVENDINETLGED